MRLEDRHKRLLGRCIRWCRKYGWWPSATEIIPNQRRSRRPRFNGLSRVTFWREMKVLAGAGLVEKVPRGEGRGWRVTPAGFALMGETVFAARLRGRPGPRGTEYRRIRRLARLRDAYVAFEGGDGGELETVD